MPFSSKIRTPAQTAGLAGEDRALSFFTAQGWKLLERNWLARTGEIDLIFEDDKHTIVFVEVRLRTRSDYGSAQATVDIRKQRKVVRTALQYVKAKKLWGRDLRFDVAAISPEGFEHIPNAFSSDGYTL